jgi:hypothetical protein
MMCRAGTAPQLSADYGRQASTVIEFGQIVARAQEVLV